MPAYVLQRISDALNDHRLPLNGARVLLLGMAYKPGVSDTRESPSLEILRQLRLRGSDIRYCDPCVPTVRIDGDDLWATPWSPRELAGADCVVMLTPHREFLDATPWDLARLVVDTRNVVPDGPGVWRI